ncbi:MAG: hypothetical protein N2167_05330 [Flavobacteriales bacterium]|nr:hypothetical protein [Flavobacteriales bacterium]
MKRYSLIIIGALFITSNITILWLNLRHSNQQAIDISDYVFDWYYDGKMNSIDAAKHPDFKIYSLQDAEKFIKANRHLPYIDSRKSWEKYSKIPLEKLVSQQWVALEILWLHTLEQQAQIEELKRMLQSSSTNSLKQISDEELSKILKENKESNKLSTEELKKYKIEFERRGLRLE